MRESSFVTSPRWSIVFLRFLCFFVVCSRLTADLPHRSRTHTSAAGLAVAIVARAQEQELDHVGPLPRSVLQTLVRTRMAAPHHRVAERRRSLPIRRCI